MKIGATIFLLTCALLTGCGPYDPKSASSLAQCYKEEFGTLPSPKIRVLDARQVVIRDWGAQWLRLELKEDALESVVLAKGFTRSKFTPDEFTRPGPNVPDWWKVTPIDSFEFYEHPDWTKGTWSTSRAVLAVDRTSGIAFFRCDRTD